MDDIIFTISQVHWQHSCFVCVCVCFLAYHVQSVTLLARLYLYSFQVFGSFGFTQFCSVISEHYQMN